MKFSFVVPVYNVEPEYFKKCVSSLLNQNTSNFEVLIIDDGSQAMYAEEYEKIVSEKKNIKLFHLENNGVSAARNFGIEKASGEWIIFVDSDDWVTDNMLATVSEALEEDIDILLFSAMIDNGSVAVPNYFFDEDVRYFEGSEKNILQLQAICKRILPYKNPTANTVGVPWGKCYRKSLITDNRIRFNVGQKISEDTIFNLYAFEKAAKAKYIKQPLYYYRKNENSATQKFHEDTIEINNLILSEIEKFYQKFNKFSDEIFVECYNYKAIDAVISIILNYIFHPNNKFGLRQKRMKFNELYKLKPYCDAIKTMRLNDLGKRARIPAFFVKYKCFAGEIFAVKAYKFLEEFVLQIRKILH